MDPFDALQDHLKILGFGDAFAAKLLAECRAERDDLKKQVTSAARLITNYEALLMKLDTTGKSS